MKNVNLGYNFKLVKNFALGFATGLVIAEGAKYCLKKNAERKEAELINDQASRIRIEEAIHYNNGEVIYIPYIPENLNPDAKEENYDLSDASYVEIFNENGEVEIISVKEYEARKNNEEVKKLVKSIK